MKVVKIRFDESFNWMVCEPEKVHHFFNVGDKYQIEVVDMTEEEMSKLKMGEW